MCTHSTLTKLTLFVFCFFISLACVFTQFLFAHIIALSLPLPLFTHTRAHTPNINACIFDFSCLFLWFLIVAELFLYLYFVPVCECERAFLIMQELMWYWKSKFSDWREESNEQEESVLFYRNVFPRSTGTCMGSFIRGQIEHLSQYKTAIFV